MEYNKLVDLSKSYLFCQLKRNRENGVDGLNSRLLPFITISREAGAGETDITIALLDELNSKQAEGDCPWTLYDKDLVKRVVDDYNLSGIGGLLPEKKFSDIQTMFEELFGLHPTKRELVYNFSKSILKLAELGNAIIVGRGAFYITRHFTSGLHIRFVGSLQKRTKHLVEEYSFTLKQADEYIRKEDQQRHDYVKKLFGVDLNDPHHYDLVINTDRLTQQEIVAIITTHIEILREKLAVFYHSGELTAI